MIHEYLRLARSTGFPATLRVRPRRRLTHTCIRISPMRICWEPTMKNHRHTSLSNPNSCRAGNSPRVCDSTMLRKIDSELCTRQDLPPTRLQVISRRTSERHLWGLEWARNWTVKSSSSMVWAEWPTDRTALGLVSTSQRNDPFTRRCTATSTLCPSDQPKSTGETGLRKQPCRWATKCSMISNSSSI